MKILFLDIDGVLNSFNTESLRRSRKTINECSSELEYVGQEIDLDKVERLNTIVENTNCSVVISSSWRNGGGRKSFLDKSVIKIGRTPDEMQKLLSHRGFRGKVIGETKRLYHKLSTPTARAEEIYDWLQNNNCSKFAIIDDLDIFAGYSENRKIIKPKLEKYFIKTDPTLGLTNQNMEQTIKILNYEVV